MTPFEAMLLLDTEVGVCVATTVGGEPRYYRCINGLLQVWRVGGGWQVVTERDLERVNYPCVNCDFHLMSYTYFSLPDGVYTRVKDPMFARLDGKRVR